jgi:hypothetical protein
MCVGLGLIMYLLNLFTSFFDIFLGIFFAFIGIIIIYISFKVMKSVEIEISNTPSNDIIAFEVFKAGINLRNDLRFLLLLSLLISSVIGVLGIVFLGIAYNLEETDLLFLYTGLFFAFTAFTLNLLVLRLYNRIKILDKAINPLKERLDNF